MGRKAFYKDEELCISLTFTNIVCVNIQIVFAGGEFCHLALVLGADSD